MANAASIAPRWGFRHDGAFFPKALPWALTLRTFGAQKGATSK
jgi:hypothetical protein